MGVSLPRHHSHGGVVCRIVSDGGVDARWPITTPGVTTCGLRVADQQPGWSREPSLSKCPEGEHGAEVNVEVKR